MCLDETGFKLNMTSVYGWAPKGKRAIDSAPGKRGKLITTIGAMNKDGFLCSALGYGGIDKDGFFAFMTTQLFPMLKRGTLILLDNLSPHKDKRVQQVAKVSLCFPKCSSVSNVETTEFRLLLQLLLPQWKH